MNNNRIVWVDYAKVLLIFCVCLVHTHCNETLTTLLKAFIIPSFFFVSGYLFRMKPDMTMRGFAWRRFRQLIVPYLWINAIAYVCWLTVLRHFGPDAASVQPWHEPLVATLLGLPSGLVHDIPTWFLVCLFCTEMIYYPAGCLIKRDAVIAVVFLAISYGMSFLPFELPFALGPAMAGTAFYAIGHLCRSRLGFLSAERWFGPLQFLAAAVAVAVFACLALTNSRVGFFVNYYGNFMLFVMAALSGIFMVISISATFAHFAGERGLIMLVSNSTLIICGFHLLMFAAIKGVFYFGFHVTDYNSLQSGSILAGVLMSVAAMGLCIPVAMFIRRYARWLVDK